MAESPISRAEVNSGFTSIRREFKEAIQPVRDDVQYIRDTMDKQNEARYAEAKEAGKAENQLEELRKRVDSASNRAWAVVAGLAVQFIYTFFSARGGK